MHLICIKGVRTKRKCVTVFKTPLRTSVPVLQPTAGQKSGGRFEILTLELDSAQRHFTEGGVRWLLTKFILWSKGSETVHKTPVGGRLAHSPYNILSG